jgi:hypothetical protein
VPATGTVDDKPQARFAVELDRERSLHGVGGGWLAGVRQSPDQPGPERASAVEYFLAGGRVNENDVKLLVDRRQGIRQSVRKRGPVRARDEQNTPVVGGDEHRRLPSCPQHSHGQAVGVAMPGSHQQAARQEAENRSHGEPVRRPLVRPTGQRVTSDPVARVMSRNRRE